MYFQLFNLVPLSFLFSLANSQDIESCTPLVSGDTNLLLGGRVNLRNHQNSESSLSPALYWNASFPYPDFSLGFNQVILEEMIDDEDWSVSEWEISVYDPTSDNPQLFRISSTVGPPGSSVDWCLSSNATSLPCDQVEPLLITCNDCTASTTNFTACSIRNGYTNDTEYGACLSWSSEVGSVVTVGDILIGPYECYETVDILPAAQAPTTSATATSISSSATTQSSSSSSSAATLIGSSSSSAAPLSTPSASGSGSSSKSSSSGSSSSSSGSVTSSNPSASSSSSSSSSGSTTSGASSSALNYQVLRILMGTMLMIFLSKFM